METILNAQQARELAMLKSNHLLQPLMGKIKRECEAGNLQITIDELEAPTSVRLHLKQKGYKVSGVVRNGVKNNITINWE